MNKNFKNFLKMSMSSNKKSKYSNLKDDVILKKIKALPLSEMEELTDELTKRVNSLTLNFSREEAEDLLTVADTKLVAIKEEKKRKEEEIKNLELQAAKEEADRIKREKEERVQKYKPLVEPSDFASVKTSFSFIKENENGEPLFSNLDEQVKFCLTEHPFKLYKAVYREKNVYDENNSYLHTNLNSGFAGIFSELKDYMYACFRLAVNPLDGTCLYNSWWIINSELSIEEVLESDSILFEFTEVPSDKIVEFIQEFRRSSSQSVLDETYSK